MLRNEKLRSFKQRESSSLYSFRIVYSDINRSLKWINVLYIRWHCKCIKTMCYRALFKQRESSSSDSFRIVYFEYQLIIKMNQRVIHAVILQVYKNHVSSNIVQATGIIQFVLIPNRLLGHQQVSLKISFCHANIRSTVVRCYATKNLVRSSNGNLPVCIHSESSIWISTSSLKWINVLYIQWHCKCIKTMCYRALFKQRESSSSDSFRIVYFEYQLIIKNESTCYTCGDVASV